MSKTQTCKEASASSGELMFGTVPRVDHWFLLEYDGHWEKDAVEKSTLPEDVKRELKGLLESFKNSRIQLISRESTGDSGICLYYVNTTEFEPATHKFMLQSHEDILGLNLKSLIEKGDINDSRTDERLALVCTHGSYDSCCGKHGVPVYNEIKKNENLSVWKTTHVGSHRFSANIVMLPEGIYYGRVDTDNLKNIIDSHLGNKIYLQNYRGRCCYNQPAQVSDYFLRNEINNYGIYDFRLEFIRDRDQNITVEFKKEDENLVYTVSSIVFNNALKIKTSCLDEHPTSIHQFYFYSLIPFVPPE